MRAYGDNHWSENRYWTHIVDEAGMSISDSYYGDDGYLKDEYITSNRDELIDAEKEANYTHELPRTKTQQYYEMIYKYLHQFGVGWDDVETHFGDPYYYDAEGAYKNTTPMIEEYRDMRNLSNDYYAQADLMVNLVLVNHIFSAVDAVFAAKQYNSSVKYSLKAHQRRHGSETVNMYGISVAW